MAPVSGMIKKQSHLLRMTVHLFFRLILLIIYKYTRPLWNKDYSKTFAILCIDRAEAANPYIDSDNTWTGVTHGGADTEEFTVRSLSIRQRDGAGLVQRTL